jgi:hypothetical protein
MRNLPGIFLPLADGLCSHFDYVSCNKPNFNFFHKGKPFMRKHIVLATFAGLCLVGMTACQQKSDSAPTDTPPAPTADATTTTTTTPTTTADATTTTTTTTPADTTAPAMSGTSVSGTAPAMSGTSSVSGTAPAMSGTSVSGTAPAMSGVATPSVSGTAPDTSSN